LQATWTDVDPVAGDAMGPIDDLQDREQHSTDAPLRAHAGVPLPRDRFSRASSLGCASKYQFDALYEVSKNMFVNNEITERGLLHKLLKAEAATVTIDERRVWAQSIDGAINDASRPSTLARMRLTHPAVVTAAAPALSAVAATLRDEQEFVSREALDTVRAFMTDGIDSPLYGRDPLAAHRAADELRNLVVTGRIAQRSREVAHAGAA
jgi:hypothetical protein